jgi:urease accessory protein UreF
MLPADAPPVWPIQGVVDAASLQGFLDWYCTQVLVPIELPLACQAYWHARRFELRELLALDRRMGEEGRLGHFAAASRAVGRVQLWRLLPLRDQRLVRRYWQALERGQAHGWHPLTYGVVLAAFSLPLRQGLVHYGWQTICGFVRAAAGPLGLTEEAHQPLVDGTTAALPAAVDKTLNATQPVGLLLC